MSLRSKLRNAAINLALLLGTLLLCFLALEVGLRVLGGRRGDWYGTGAERAEFVRDHVRTNSLGFRDREFGAPKPGVERILAIGDSFTFGDSIPNVDDTWPRVLERRLNDAGTPAEVLNLGVPGTNTAYQRELLDAKGWGLAPARIVLAFVPNDPEPPKANRNILPERLNPPLLPLPRLDRALSRGSHAYAWLRAKKNEILVGWGNVESYTDYVHSLYRPGPDWDAFTEAARAIGAGARERGIPLTVALFPMFHDLEHDPFAAETEKAAAVFREAGADVLDLRPAFAGHASSELWIASSDAHPNELAHRLAAEAIARHLRPIRASLNASTGLKTGP